eukprot:2539767-Pyramimonas_sp.AAC.1
MVSETAFPVLHRSIKGTLQPTEELDLSRQYTISPKDTIDHKVGNWHRLWCSKPVDRDKLYRTFDSVREAAEVEAPPFTGLEIQAAVHQMRPRAGQGADGLSHLDVERLPLEGLDELAGILNAV